MSKSCIYDKVITFENLYLAYRQVRLNKRDYNIQQKYEFDLECNLANLQKRLQDPRKYKVKKYNKFKIYEPKMRQVSAPYFEDRIVHQAIHRIIEPGIVSKFIPTTYACLKNRGTHKAVKDLQHSLSSESLRGAFYLKADIKSYFASINQTILKKLIRKYISCEKILIVLDKIIDRSSKIEASSMHPETSRKNYENDYHSHSSHKRKREGFLSDLFDF